MGLSENLEQHFSAQTHQKHHEEETVDLTTIAFTNCTDVSFLKFWIFRENGIKFPK